MIDTHKTSKQEDLIRLLNPILRGWALYHQPVVAKQAYSRMDNRAFIKLWRWAKGGIQTSPWTGYGRSISDRKGNEDGCSPPRFWKRTDQNGRSSCTNLQVHRSSGTKGKWGIQPLRPPHGGSRRKTADGTDAEQAEVPEANRQSIHQPKWVMRALQTADIQGNRVARPPHYLPFTRRWRLPGEPGTIAPHLSPTAPRTWSAREQTGPLGGFG